MSASRDAQCRAQHKLAAPLGAAGQQQVRHVRTRNQQHQRHRSQQDPERLSAAPGNPLQFRLHPGRGKVLSVIGILSR
jgi:hypothetical protein